MALVLDHNVSKSSNSNSPERDYKMQKAAETILNKIIEYAEASGKCMDEMAEELKNATSRGRKSS